MHPEAREAGLLGGARDLGERLGRGRGMARPAEALDLQAEREPLRILVLAGGGVQRADEVGRNERHRAGGVHAGPVLPRQRVGHRGGRAQLVRDDPARHGPRAGAVAGAHDRVRGLDHDGVGGDAVPRGERAPRRPAPGLQTRGVDHRRQPAREALLHDQVEHLEGVAARPLVAVPAPDGRAERVGRDDLLGREPLRGPVRLARRGGSDQDDEAGIGQPQHAAGLPHASHPGAPGRCSEVTSTVRPAPNGRSRRLTPMDHQRAGTAAALVTVVLWASAFVGIRAAGEDFSAGTLTLGRLLAAAVVLGLFVAARGTPCPPRAGRRPPRAVRPALARRLQRAARTPRSSASTRARRRCS